MASKKVLKLAEDIQKLSPNSQYLIMKLLEIIIKTVDKK